MYTACVRGFTMVPIVYQYRSRFYQWYLGNTICTNGNANGTIGSLNGTMVSITAGDKPGIKITQVTIFELWGQ